MTVTDVDERREVRADRVWSWPGGSGPAGASSAGQPWTLTPTGRKRQPTTGWRRADSDERRAGERGRGAAPASFTRSSALTVVIARGRHGRLRA